MFCYLHYQDKHKIYTFLKYEESTLFHLEKTVPINNHMIECI